MLNKIIFLSFTIFSFSSYAGSCCGGGGGSAKLMLGDTSSVFRLGYSDRTILADISEDGRIELRAYDNLESIREFNISTSIRLMDYWQYGGALKTISKTKKIRGAKEFYSGLGDVELSIAYEFMPEYSNTSFISKGFVFLQLVLPTGISLYTTKRTDTLDTLGSGHYLISLGTIFTKRFRWGMTTVNLNTSYRPSRTFKKTLFTSGEIKTNDSFNYGISLNQNIDITKGWSANLSISRNYYSNLPTSILSGELKSAALNSFSTGLSYSTEFYSYLITYIDDFLIGSSYNQVLGKSLGLSVIKRINL